MKKTLTLLCLLASVLQGTAKAYIENKGQIIDQDRRLNPAVLYLFNGDGLNVQLRKTGFSYDLWKNDERSETVRFHRVDLEFVNPVADIKTETSGISPDYLNYYTEYTGKQGVVKVRSYQAVTYKNIWPGIDLQFELKNERPKYNFILHPGADIGEIKLNIKGAEGIDQKGSGLVLHTSLGDVNELLPNSYYTAGTEQVNIKAAFVKNADGNYTINIKEQIPQNATVVIDPVPTILWGTFYGGNKPDISLAVRTDNSGNVYMGGNTESTMNIATAGAYEQALQGGVGAKDAFFTKFNALGHRLWATYYGGTAVDNINALVPTENCEHLYIAGITQNPNLGTTGTYQELIGSPGKIRVGFVAKFDSAGQRKWCTYYGDSAASSIGSIVCDMHDNVYFGGDISSNKTNRELATPGALKDSTVGSSDGILAKLDSTGKRVWGTYFGGNAMDMLEVTGIRGDTAIYVSGATNSVSGIATAGSFQSLRSGAHDLFVGLFDSTGKYKWGTYVGGPDVEMTTVFDIKFGTTDKEGSVYICGPTKSKSAIASPGAHQPTYGGGNSDAFIAKFDKTGQRIWSTYYGGDADDEVYALATDGQGNLYFTGHSTSTNNIAMRWGSDTENTNSAKKMFIGKFDRNGVRRWATYYAGARPEAICTDVLNDVYISGEALVAQVGTPGSHQQYHAGGGTDGFLLKILGCKDDYATITTNFPIIENGIITFDVSHDMAYTYKWSHAGGFTSELRNPTISSAKLSDSGVYTVIVTDSAWCLDTATVHITVQPDMDVSDQFGSNIHIYPNPTADMLFIDNKNKEQGYLGLTNLQGQIIFETKLQDERHSIDMHGIASGTYNLILRQDGKIRTTKIIVTR